jgi:hypothetical protein
MPKTSFRKNSDSPLIKAAGSLDIIKTKGLRVVSLDLPTSHQFAITNDDEFTGRMLSAINCLQERYLVTCQAKHLFY